MFLLIINENTNADRILLFEFENVSNFNWKIYVFKV